jgi:hypothetical protein
LDLLQRHPALRRPPRDEVISKPGGSRRLIRLDTVDADTYRRLVARAAPAIEYALGPRVIANRVTGPSLRLEDWRAAHRRWRRAVVGRGGGLRLRLDVADCYGSIRPHTVMAALASLGVESEGLNRFLHELAEHGVAGLPVGPEPSAVLANAVLHRLDAAIASTGVPHVRWVDDVVAVADGRRAARRALDAARRSLDELGLRPNVEKTLVEDHRRRAHGGVSSAPAAVR